MRSPILAFSLFAVVGPTIVAAAPSSPKPDDGSFTHARNADDSLSKRFLDGSDPLGFLEGAGGQSEGGSFGGLGADSVAKALSGNTEEENDGEPARTPRQPVSPTFPTYTPFLPARTSTANTASAEPTGTTNGEDGTTGLTGTDVTTAPGTSDAAQEATRVDNV